MMNVISSRSHIETDLITVNLICQSSQYFLTLVMHKPLLEIVIMLSIFHSSTVQTEMQKLLLSFQSDPSGCSS